jgi:DNA-binding PadR family transcriptional regulator
MSPMIKLPLATEHALLGLLRQEPMHPYEMHQQLQQAKALGLVWRLKQSHLYALLSRLEEAGYIESTLEVQGSRPPRKIMRLTPSGALAFETWLVTPVEHGRDFRLEFLAKLYFAGQEGPAAIAKLIEAQQQACATWLADLRAQADQLGDRSAYEWLVLQFRIGQIEAIVNWLDTCRATLQPFPA